MSFLTGNLFDVFVSVSIFLQEDKARIFFLSTHFQVNQLLEQGSPSGQYAASPPAGKLSLSVICPLFLLLSSIVVEKDETGIMEIN